MNIKDLWPLKIIIAIFCFMVICSSVEFLFYMTFMLQPIGLVFVIIGTHQLIENSQKKQYGGDEKTNAAGLSSLS